MNDTVRAPDPASEHGSTARVDASSGVDGSRDQGEGGMVVDGAGEWSRALVVSVATATVGVQTANAPVMTVASGAHANHKSNIALKSYVEQRVHQVKDTVVAQIEQWATLLHTQLRSGIPSNQEAMRGLLEKIPAPLFVTAFFRFVKHFGHSALEWAPTELQTFIGQRYFREGYEEDTARVLLYFGHKALVIQEFHKLFPDFRVSSWFVDHLLEAGCHEFVFAYLDRFGLSEADLGKKLLANRAYAEVIEYCSDPISIDPDIVGKYLDSVRMVAPRSSKPGSKARASGSTSRSAEPEKHPAVILLSRNLQKLIDMPYRAASILIEGGFALEVLQSIHRFKLTSEKESLLITQCSAILGYLAVVRKSPGTGM